MLCFSWELIIMNHHFCDCFCLFVCFTVTDFVLKHCNVSTSGKKYSTQSYAKRASYLLQNWSTWVHHLNGPLILSCFWLDEIKRVTCRYSLSPHLVSLFLKMAKRHLWCHKVLICGSSLQHLTLSLRHSMALALKHATSQTQFAAHSRNILISEPGIPNSNRLGATSNLKQKIQPPCQCTAINPEKTKKALPPLTLE